MKLQKSKRILIATALFIDAISSSAGFADEGNKPMYGSWGLDLTAMDRSVKPGDDFFRYANGAWLDRTTIPADKIGYSLATLQVDRVRDRLHAIMEHAANSAVIQPATLEGKVGAFYKAYMDEARVEFLGVKPLAPELRAISAATSRDDLAASMGKSPSDFYGSIFNLNIDVNLKDVSHYGVYLSQGGLGLPNRDYYLDPSFAPQKAAYQIYVATLLSLAGWRDSEANARAVVDFETKIAEASWTIAEQRDVGKTFNLETPEELSALAPGFAWDRFLAAGGVQRATKVIVQEKTAFPQIAAIYGDTPLDVLKAWQAFTVVDAAAGYLSKPFTDARFAFRGKVLTGQLEQQTRWELAVYAVSGRDCTVDSACSGSMGFGVGQLYTAKFFPPAAKAAIEAVVTDVKAAMRARLEKLDWMSADTKSEALKKLDTYQIKVGYPDHPRNYSGLVIRSDDLIGDVRRALAWDWKFYLGRLNGPVDRSDWSMTPQTSNAYTGSLRDVVFPAAILQAPMFDPDADPAINYGAVGSLIGHEMTHGFDDEGRKLDASGAIRDWWNSNDAEAFESRAKRLGVQYSSYEPLPGLHIDGELEMGENIADLGGITLALEAYHRSLKGRPAPVINGFTGDQRVFLGFAQAWRGKIRDDALRKQLASDQHAPRAFRVLGTTRNIDEWYEAFDVKPGDAYYLAPSDRVHIW